MSLKEYVGYLLAAMLLTWHLLSSELQMKLDWVNFGSSYQQQQQRIVEAIQNLDRDVQSVKTRLGVVEQKQTVVPPPAPEKK